MRSFRLIFFVAFLFNFSVSLFLRVETGHQNIAIDGRDTYYGHFTKIYFHNLTCINSIDINCLKELTGAEEIDLLYSECQHGTNWKVVHYTNSKHHFRLKEPIHALSLLISSRIDLSIIDVQVQSCKMPVEFKTSGCHREHLHNHRHSKTDHKIIKAHDIISNRRSKRSLDLSTNRISGNMTVTADIIVKTGEILTIISGARLQFSKGVGIIVNGRLHINGTTYSPVIMEAKNESEKWNGIHFQNGENGSVISNALISGSETGIKVEKGTSPYIEHVIVQKNTYGVQFKDLNSSTTSYLHKTTSIKNEKSGIEYIGKGLLSIDNCVTASNGGFGIFASTDSKITIRKSTSYSNNGTGIYIGTKNAQIEDTVINSNGYIGIHSEISDNLEISNVNISAHFLSFAIDIYISQNARITIFQSHFYDNKIGSIRLLGIFDQPNVIISNSRFSRNSGPIIVFNDFGKTKMNIERSVFISNSQRRNEDKDAMISIKNITDGEVSIDQCEFSQNIVSDVIRLNDVSLKGSPIKIENSDFLKNIAKSIIFTNSPTAEIAKSNRFENPKTDCDLTFTLPRVSSDSDLNLKLCSGEYHSIQSDQPNIEKEQQEKEDDEHIEFKIWSNGSVEASQTPYLINHEIYVDDELILEPGTVMDFAPGIGITVHDKGKLIVNGTLEAPVVMRGLKGNIWRGLVAKPESHLQLNNMVLEDASIGIWIDSQNVEINGGMIKNSIVHGIEITDNSNDIVDLGNIIIESSVESAIGIDERRNDLSIQNVYIQNANGNGIDFVTPTQNIEIKDVVIENSGGYGIHISEFPSSPLHSILMSNISILHQKRGNAGILVSGGWLQNIAIQNSEFFDNHVPSLIIAIECNDDSEKLIRIENSSFIQNRDIVQHVQLGACVNVQMERNNYTMNNQDGVGSTVVITTGPWPDPTTSVVEISKNNFTSNAGIYSLTLGRGTTIYVTDNDFRDNMNSGAVVKVEGDDVKLITNKFDNPKTQYTISYSEETPLEVGFNDWNGVENGQIIKLMDAPEGSIRITQLKNETNLGQSQIDTIPYSTNEGCAHLKYCSHRGTCRDSICICPQGFTGFDCSIAIVCNCSGNGLCDIFNKCICNGGWTGNNCEIPKCYKDCNQKGKCVGPNKCECNNGWIGDSCMTSTCIDSKCLNGHCSDGICKCEKGWKGSRCHIPMCSQCSLNGQCTSPDICSCFDGYQGESCEKLTRQSCDFDCDNGICDDLTNTCSCYGGWSGGACDVCTNQKNCENRSSKISYIQPSTAQLEDTNAVVTVFGSDFNITPNHSYICTFGRTTVLGFRISSTILRCPIPANMTLGRHLFTVSKPGSFETVIHSPIHFTIFDGCDISICQGSCMGPLCICPQGKTGVLCDVIELIPTIDRRFLEHQRANQAIEGTPYVVMMPTLTSSVLRVNSTIPGLNFISSKGILAWPEPIGSSDPYSISITAFSPAGESDISWNVTVKPEYSAQINDIEVENGVAIIHGRVLTNSTTKKQVPILIRIQCDGIIDEIQAESDESGDIEYTYIPMAPGKCEVSMMHPGSHTGQSSEFIIHEFNMKLNGQSDDKSLQIQVSSNSQCQARLIQPFGKEIQSFGEGNEVILKYEEEWEDEVIAWVKCADSPIEIVHAPANPIMTITPNIIAVNNPPNQLYELLIGVKNEFEIDGPIIEIYREELEDGTNRVTFEITEEYEGNGTIRILDRDKHEEKNIEIVPKIDDYAHFKICARDEWDGQEHALSIVEVATITISNSQIGVDISKPNIRLNVQWAEFTIQPGYYNLQISSESHYPFNEIIYLDQNNSTFCVNLRSSKMKSIVARSPDSDLEIRHFGEDQLPYLSFSPSLVTSPGQKILVTPKGEFNGTVGLWNQNIDPIFEILPNRRSASLNQSFWITIIWDPKSITKEDCDIKKIEIPFAFLPTNGDMAIRLSSPILVKIKPNSEVICDSNNREIEAAMLTNVMCNCGDGVRTKCRSLYRPATACGGSWQKIADDTVSLEELTSFLSMVFECNEVSVNFGEIREALQCVASIENDCPIGNRKKRQYQRDSPVNIVNHLSSVKMDLGNVLPILNALDIQTIRISTIFIDFIDQLEIVFPSEIYSNLDRSTVDRFIKAISDTSEQGNYISEEEFDEKSEILMDLWNDTVTGWKSGEKYKGKGISYENAKKLVETSDKLKSITRQNGANNPFEMLNGYMERILETSGNEQKKCANGLVYFEETEIEEGENIRIRVYIENMSNMTLTNIGVKLSFEGPSQNIRFELGPSWSAGIQSLEGMGNMEANGNFEIHWTRYVNVQRRLTSVNIFKPIIILAFSSNGRQTQQKLVASDIRIIPKKTIKTINIIRDNLSPSSLNFSMISSIINPGYSTLSDVQIIIDGLKLSDPKKYLEIESVHVNGKSSKPTLRQEFDEIHSGTTKMIRIALKNMFVKIRREKAKPNPILNFFYIFHTQITSANITCIENDKLLAMESIETYAIRASGPSDYGMLLAPINQMAPLFFFQQSAAQMVNVIKLEYLSSQKVKIDDPNKTIYMAAFRNPESSSFEGALWATMPIPELPGEINHLTQIIEHSSTRPRELQAVQWFSNENGNAMVNWIDSGSLVPQKVLTYELQFTNPDGSSEKDIPEFEEVRYRIEVPIGSKNSEIGQITANGNGNLEYILYSPNNDEKYSIDPKTGKIYQELDSEPSELEYCLVLEVRDSLGRTSRVPVSVNNGGTRSDCNIFSTTGLEPMIYTGPIVEVVTRSPFSTTEYIHVTYPDSTLETITSTTIMAWTDGTTTLSTEGMESTVTEMLATIPMETTTDSETTMDSTETSELSTSSTTSDFTIIPTETSTSNTSESSETTTMESTSEDTSAPSEDETTTSESIQTSSSTSETELTTESGQITDSTSESTTMTSESSTETTSESSSITDTTSEFTTMSSDLTTPSESFTSESPSIETTPSEVTGILPTDETTLPTVSTTEFIYTVTSDSSLEPITQIIYTITPDPSPETLRTINPEESDHTTVSPPSTVSMSSTPTTVSLPRETTTVSPAIAQACELVAQSPIYKIVCDLSKISESS